jgi:hypothetical protein
MIVVLARPAVGEAVDQPRIGVEVEDDRLVGGEESFELAVCQAVRMLGIRHQLGQIHHIDEANFDIGEVLPKQGGGGQRLHCRAVPTARHDHVGLATLVVARPVPDAGSFRAVLDRRLDVEVLEMHLFVRDDDIDVIDAAQAMIGDRQQGIGVGRQVNANDARPLIGYDVEEAGVLTSLPEDKLAGDLGNVIGATSIGGRSRRRRWQGATAVW